MKKSKEKQDALMLENNLISYILRVCAICFFVVYLILAIAGKSFEIILSGLIVSLAFVVVGEIIQILHDIRRKIYSKK